MQSSRVLLRRALATHARAVATVRDGNPALKRVYSPQVQLEHDDNRNTRNVRISRRRHYIPLVQNEFGARCFVSREQGVEIVLRTDE